jgi:hypothetical protein
MVRRASEFIIGPRFARTRWRVSNHEAAGLAAILRDTKLRMVPPAITAKPLRRDEVGAGFTARNLPDGQIRCLSGESKSSPPIKNILIFRNRKSVYIHTHPAS